MKTRFVTFSFCLAGLLIAQHVSAANFIVQMTRNQFDPRDQTINVGDSVTWTNLDFTSHTTTSGTNRVPSGVWNSGLFGNGGSFSFTFTNAGYYAYYCTPHVFTFNMAGSITVVAPNALPSVTITNPANGATFVAGVNISIQATASDSDGSVSRVDFFANGIPVGSATSVPYATTMNNIGPGNYTLTAVATDNLGATSASTAVNISVQAGNVPPPVTITNPVNNQAFMAGTNIAIEATASDSDGSISQVEFFVDGNSVGIDTGAPYAAALNNAPIGNYTLTAIATDDSGASSTSPAVNISVFVPTESPTILSPPQSQSVTNGGTVTFFVTADGTPPLSYRWLFNENAIPGATNDMLVLSNVQTNDAGEYTVTVSNVAGSATSPPATLVVTPPLNVPPVVSISSPTNGTKFPAHSDVFVTAEASDADGTITQVEFFVGGESVGVATNSPYSLVISDQLAGSYVLTAQATDDRGGTNTSAPVTISVHDPPSVIITQPAPDERFPLGSSVGLEAMVGAGSAPLVKLEFFEGSNRIVKFGAAPFGFDWNPTEARLYVLIATAMDELGQTGTSAPVAIRVFVPEFSRPALTITSSPPNFARTNSPSVTLAGTARDDIGLERIEIVRLNRFNNVTNVAVGTTNWQAEIGLLPGLNTIRVRSVDLAGNTSFEATRFFTYVVRMPLTVSTRGLGTVTPDLNGRDLEVGQIYTLRAVPGRDQIFAGWDGEGLANSNRATLSFLMASNLMVLTANFVTNPFPPVKGTYTGLFYDTNGVAPESSGFVALSVGIRGEVRGKLVMNGAAYPLRGQLDASGFAQFPVLRRQTEPVVITLNLALNAGTDEIRGMVSNGRWVANLLGDRNVFTKSSPASLAGARSFVLKNTADDTVAAVAAAKIGAAGRVRVAGALSDGRKFSLGTALAKNGDCPFYLPLSRGAEVMIGWVRFSDDAGTPVGGTLFWTKTGTNGFHFELHAVAPGP